MKTIKNLILVAVISLPIFIFSGCVKTPVSDQTIREDLQEFLYYSFDHNVTITDFEIYDRKTDTSNKIDQAFVKVNAENESVSCNLNFIVNYYLFDQGWTLDYIQENYALPSSYTPLKAPSEEIAISRLLSENINGVVDSVDFSPETNSAVFHLKHIREYEFATITTLFSVPCSFNTENGTWTASNLQADVNKYNWNITGTWLPVSSPYTGWYAGCKMEIGEFANDTANIKFYKDNILLFDQNVTFGDNNSSISFKVATTESSWDNINMKINPEFIGAEQLGTRGGCAFEKQ